MIPSHATVAGTQAYRERHSGLAFATLGQTHLEVSQIGFGGYRIAQGVAGHRQALAHALQQGINLVDTSTNYADGQSEALVGDVLADLIGAGKIRREEVVIVSKVGYLQGANFELSQQRKAQGQPFPELVPYGKGLEHCLHPEFIADQLTRSLERLQLTTLDFYLLHNPEYYLSWGQNTKLSQEELRKEYERRLAAAFGHLETEVAAGRIQHYGVSSNTFPLPKGNPEFTDLAVLEDIAAQVTENPHFRLIQLPFNLLEPGAALESNQPQGRTVLAQATAHGLAVLVNRPLNAFDGRQLVRLAEPEARRAASHDDIIAAIRAIGRSEKTFWRRLLPELNVPLPLQQRLKDQVSIADTLKHYWRNFGSYERWRQTRDGMLQPRIQGVLDYLEAYGADVEGLSSWLEHHPQAIAAAYKAVGSIYAEPLHRKLTALRTRLNAVNADWGDVPTFSAMAVRALRSTTGVSTVLVGMRKKTYVDEMVAELNIPLTAREHATAWRALNEKESDEV